MTTGEPLVSVVMPFLNTERFITEAIESVLAQTYNAWELLVVDDGSVDGSTRIARDYAGRHPDRIRYFEHAGHGHRGASAARNVGLRHARGEFVALLDADDVWLPSKLREQVPLLAARPEVGSLYGNTLYWYSWTGPRPDGPSDFLPALGVPPGTVLFPPRLLIECLRGRAAVPCTCSILMRRSVLEQIGGFEERFRQVFTDQALYAKLFLAAPVMVIDQCWDKYRLHDDSSCALMRRQGQEAERRLAYLLWLSDLLTARNLDHGEVWEVLQTALWPYRHPYLSRSLEAAARVRRQGRALAGRLLHPWLPPS